MAHYRRQHLYAVVLLAICGLILFFVQRSNNQGQQRLHEVVPSLTNSPNSSIDDEESSLILELTPCSSKTFSCLPKELKGARQEDPRLIEYIRKKMINLPSPHPYNLQRPYKIHFSQSGQSEYANSKFLHGMKSGFFIEAGAVDGEFLSNTLFFERELGWRGLLVEPNAKTYKRLLTKHRKAYSINVALSESTEASEVPFKQSPQMGVVSHLGGKADGLQTTSIPLISLLMALKVTVVDFLSLDIETYELKILSTIPWDKVKFRLMCLECPHCKTPTHPLNNYLTKRGYIALGVVGVDAWFGWPELLNSTMISDS